MNANEIKLALESKKELVYMKLISVKKVLDLKKIEKRTVSSFCEKFLENRFFPEKEMALVVFSNDQKEWINTEDLSISCDKDDSTLFRDQARKEPINYFLSNGRTKLVFSLEKARSLTKRVGYFYPVFNHLGNKVAFAIPS